MIEKKFKERSAAVPLEFEFENVRRKIFVYSLYFLMARSLVLAAFHFSNQRYGLAISLLAFYPIPCLLTIYYVKRENAAKLIPAFLFYFFTLGLYNRLNCEPLYLAVYFLLPGKVALAFLTTEVKTAALLSAYAALTVVVPSLIVFFFEPFPILYRNADMIGGMLVTFTASTGMVAVASYVHSKRMKVFTEKTHATNAEYKLLLSTVLHDFANDLQIGKMSFDALKNAKDATAKTRNEDRLRRSLDHLVEMIHALRDTKDRLPEQSSAPTSAVSILEVLNRAELVFEEPLSKKNLKVRADRSALINARVSVDPSSFSLHVFNNIFGNAVKFAPKGAELVLETEQQGKFVTVRLTNVIGDQSSATKGTGMGLRIAKDLCEKTGIVLSTDSNGTLWTAKLEVPAA